MRVLYVAPRYHTNQVSIMKGWLEHGHKVCFLSQFKGTSEDYTVLQPVILGYSVLFELIMYLYRFLFCRNEKSDTKEFDFRSKAGFPPIGKAYKYIREFGPDFVIVRERSVYSALFTLICKLRKIPCILYNQSPLWDKPDKNSTWKNRAFAMLFPRKRMTPVLGSRQAGAVPSANSFFVPFIVEPRYSLEEKCHFLDEKIQVLCVGRYEERKNLFLLLEVMKELAQRYSFHLTIIGEALDDNQIEYLEKLRQKVSEYGFEPEITLRKNLEIEEVYEAYKRADLFVLPSTRERASIAQLEAMSCSLPVICSDTNGSACYVENGKNGWLFRDNDGEDLKQKIESMLSDKTNLLEMGKNSYILVNQKYQFKNYYQKIMELLKETIS